MIFPSLLLAAAPGLAQSGEQAAICSFYGSYYSVGKHRMANGAIYRDSGLTCATYRYPLGTRIKISANGKSFIFIVTDRTAKKYGHRLDLPDKSWLRFGYPKSKGLFKAKVVKL